MVALLATSTGLIAGLLEAVRLSCPSLEISGHMTLQCARKRTLASQCSKMESAIH